MQWFLLISFAVIGAVTSQRSAFTEDDAVVRGPRYSSQEGQNLVQPSQFYRSPSAAADEQDSTPQATLAYRRPLEDDQLVKSQRRPVQYIQNQKDSKQALEEEEEIEEPDRLSELLPSSTFTCQGRQTGYYADEGLSCEVFHYCQENAKHSWICPEGFSFHQVHLICMPPSSDNICDQSSNFHFVNEYLYKPINQQEADNEPNVTLKYADRYYPENVHQNAAVNQGHQSGRQPLQVGLPARRVPSPAPQVTPLPYRHSTSQVFRSPEEINIPLQQRRPSAPSHNSRPAYPAQSYDDEQDFQYET